MLSYHCLVLTHCDCCEQAEKQGRKIICKNEGECVHLFQRLTEAVSAYQQTETAAESDLKKDAGTVFREQVSE